MANESPAAVLVDENGNIVGITLDGSVYKIEGLTKLRNSSDAIVNPSTEDTLATRASESTLSTRATESTLTAADAKLATIDSVLDLIKDTDGIKKITDELPAGTQEIGAVKQGTKAANADAWPIVQVDGSGNPATITLDSGIYRQEITGKVTVIGAQAPPSTTAQVITADTPLTVGTSDTVFVIPNGETFHLQQIIAGNEDPTKGAVIEVIFDDGTEHVVERVYTSGATISVGYSDVTTARDGTSLTGNGTNELIVRRAKYAGTNIAIDAEVVGYTS